ncbi:hypothetical protein CYLTODRAFT_411422 [Cylindrobasidium torrendii FP15055 ss-10]|uniref:F-box domain-containing protein n=1 Tax=Cylindrobasidium torrendii FP15055 ss-10 TaxID=1314674 RepID=A0A0D7B940_9AGAR|nr:hypothetical protein CYLTODRAFT_411422 [Cylindrobasidium torrendii FP15055 ss-10]
MSLAPSAVSYRTIFRDFLDTNIYKAHTPMLSFPYEIVASIAEAYVLNDYSVFQIAGGLPPQLVLMAVCRNWKSVCTSHPSLWTRICIDILPANPTATTDASIWKRFAAVCQDALTWSKSLPLDLKFDRWHLSNKVYQTVIKTGYDGQVFDSTTLAIKIMQFSIQQSSRWRSFTMQSIDHMIPETPGIPWSDLVNVTNRVPKLETLCFDHFCEVNPSDANEHRPWNKYMDTFLDAPSLGVATFAVGLNSLNLPWAQLTKIDILTGGYLDLQRHGDYFDTIMRHTTASTVSWGDNFYGIRYGAFAPRPSMVIENPHIVKLNIPPVLLPPLLLPNLTNLEFYISEKHVDTVSQIVLLLKDSSCRLLNLTINQWRDPWDSGDIYSFVHLLPYLDSLQSLTWNASLVDMDIMIELLEGLRVILGANDPVELPNLTTLVINCRQSYAQDCYHTCDLDSPEARAVWGIVQTRMLGWPVVKLEKFQITVRKNKENPLPMTTSSKAFEESEEGKNIKASGVDFELHLPV